MPRKYCRIRWMENWKNIRFGKSGLIFIYCFALLFIWSQYFTLAAIFSWHLSGMTLGTMICYLKCDIISPLSFAPTIQLFNITTLYSFICSNDNDFNLIDVLFLLFSYSKWDVFTWYVCSGAVTSTYFIQPSWSFFFAFIIVLRCSKVHYRHIYI